MEVSWGRNYDCFFFVSNCYCWKIITKCSLDWMFRRLPTVQLLRDEYAAGQDSMQAGNWAQAEPLASLMTLVLLLDQRERTQGGCLELVQTLIWTNTHHSPFPLLRHASTLPDRPISKKKDALHSEIVAKYELYNQELLWRLWNIPPPPQPFPCVSTVRSNCSVTENAKRMHIQKWSCVLWKLFP